MRQLVLGAALALLAAAPDAMAQYYYRPVEFGAHCRTRIATAYGVSPLVCPIAQPKPLGRACRCPPPGYGPWLRGRTVR